MRRASGHKPETVRPPSGRAEEQNRRSSEGDPDRSKKVWPEAEPAPYGAPDTGPARVSEYSSVNVGHEEPQTEANEAPDKQGDIDREDRQVLLRLAARLKERDELDLTRVQVRVENGAVTLKGKVTSDAARMEIREIAQTIPGVREIEDRLEIENY